MKRLIALALALIAILSFAGCKKEPSYDEPDTIPAPPTYEIKKYTEDIIWNDKDQGDVILLYPELKGYDDANKIIFDLVKEKCNAGLPNLSSYENDAMPEVTYEIDSFSVTYVSDTFLSGTVEGMLTVSLAAHPSPFVYAVNIDLENLSELRTNEILDNFDKIKELFNNGKFTLEKGIDDLSSQISFEDMIMQYRSEYEIYPEIWFSDNKLYMNIELVYALGSGAIYSISLDEVQNFLNQDNKEISKITK